MKHGDLSNEVVPRLLLVFEGALGVISASDRRAFDKDIKRQHWHAAAERWTIVEPMAMRIWYLARHLGHTLDVVTFAGPEPFGEELAYRLQEVEELPVNHVYATEERKLARKITYMPDVAKVYDPEPRRWLTWGSKGYHLTNPNQLGT